MKDHIEPAGKRFFLELRSRLIHAVRSFFHDQGFLEIQTPLLTTAPAPEPHIEAIAAAQGRFLITSPELYMKRLLAAGYERIFQITPVFRAAERGRYHHPEFSLLEWYRANADYRDLQKDCADLLRTLHRRTAHTAPWRRGDTRLEVDGDWLRYTVREAFLKFAGWEPGPDVDLDRFDVDLVEKVEPHLGFPRPCILEDYPANQAALARLKPGDPSVAERFELYWAGIELANGYSELNDPEEQRTRFEDAIEKRRKAGLLPYPLPHTFLESLEHLPPSAGIALGVDRLVMLATGAGHIDQVVAFPPDPG